MLVARLWQTIFERTNQREAVAPWVCTRNGSDDSVAAGDECVAHRPGGSVGKVSNTASFLIWDNINELAWSSGKQVSKLVYYYCYRLTIYA